MYERSIVRCKIQSLKKDKGEDWIAMFFVQNW